MNSELGSHPSPDSLKRKRESLTEDDARDPERDGQLEKKNRMNSDEAGPANKTPATVDTIQDLIRDVGHHAYLTSTVSNSAATSTGTSTTGTTAQAEAVTTKPSLQTLPRELRDLIYDFVAATEERIVLGRRMVEARQNNSTWTLDKCFDEAIALHPLSMTCRQFRDEFHDAHISAPNAPWVLLVNNFHLEQLQIFSDYIQSEEYIKVTGHDLNSEDCWPYSPPIYNQDISLRFQMDDLAPHSASEFCKTAFFEHRGNAPPSLADEDVNEVWLGFANFATEYVPRTTAPVANRQSMTLEQATNIKAMFEALYRQIAELPDFLIYEGESDLETGHNELSESFR
jgi:hypothetical protein